VLNRLNRLPDLRLTDLANRYYEMEMPTKEWQRIMGFSFPRISGGWGDQMPSVSDLTPLIEP